VTLKRIPHPVEINPDHDGARKCPKRGSRLLRSASQESRSKSGTEEILLPARVVSNICVLGSSRCTKEACTRIQKRKNTSGDKTISIHLSPVSWLKSTYEGHNEANPRRTIQWRRGGADKSGRPLERAERDSSRDGPDIGISLVYWAALLRRAGRTLCTGFAFAREGRSSVDLPDTRAGMLPPELCWSIQSFSRERLKRHRFPSLNAGTNPSDAYLYNVSALMPEVVRRLADVQHLALLCSSRLCLHRSAIPPEELPPGRVGHFHCRCLQERIVRVAFPLKEPLCTEFGYIQ